METRQPTRAAGAQDALPALPQEPPAVQQPAVPHPRSLAQRAVDAIDGPGAIEYASWLQLLRHLGA